MVSGPVLGACLLFLCIAADSPRSEAPMSSAGQHPIMHHGLRARGVLMLDDRNV